jgi:hypothetical protein
MVSPALYLKSFNQGHHAGFSNPYVIQEGRCWGRERRKKFNSRQKNNALLNGEMAFQYLSPQGASIYLLTTYYV